MAEEPLAIVDTNFRVYNPELDNQLNMTSAEHLKAAEKKEEHLLNKSGILDLFIEAAFKIESVLAKKFKVR